MDGWNALASGGTKPHRTEALISEHILRQGPWKLVVGGTRYTPGHERQAWDTSFLKVKTLCPSFRKRFCYPFTPLLGNRDVF